jgi:L-asparaginase/Glu-tRNA(Gln) amidotransferase subunit D
MDKAIRESRWLPPITAWHLAPQKARILPMLALSRSTGDAEVRQIFRTC